MTAIPYGNLRVEINSDIGARVQRVGLSLRTGISAGRGLGYVVVQAGQE
jgi:hypothetical protein